MTYSQHLNYLSHLNYVVDTAVLWQLERVPVFEELDAAVHQQYLDHDRRHQNDDHRGDQVLTGVDV